MCPAAKVQETIRVLDCRFAYLLFAPISGLHVSRSENSSDRHDNRMKHMHYTCICILLAGSRRGIPRTPLSTEHRLPIPLFSEGGLGNRTPSEFLFAQQCVHPHAGPHLPSWPSTILLGDQHNVRRQFTKKSPALEKVAVNKSRGIGKVFC